MSNKIATENQSISPKLTLAEVEVGQKCVIVECSLPTKVKARFAEMGLVPNTEVRVLRIAPLGDPIVVRARGYELCLRIETAKNFAVSIQ